MPLPFASEIDEWVDSGGWICPEHANHLSALERCLPGALVFLRRERWLGRELEEAGELALRLEEVTIKMFVRRDAISAALISGEGEMLMLKETTLKNDDYPFLGALQRLTWRVELVDMNAVGPAI